MKPAVIVCSLSDDERETLQTALCSKDAFSPYVEARYSWQALAANAHHR
jgi:hypothetical protein